MCTPSNICFLGPTRVHIPYSISIASEVFAQLTAESPCTLQLAVPSPKIAPSYWGIWYSIYYIVPWAHQSTQPKPYLDRFSRFCTANGRASLCFTMGRPFRQNCHFLWGIWYSICYMVPWPHQSTQPKRYLDRFSRFCRVHDRDRQTDRQT